MILFIVMLRTVLRDFNLTIKLISWIWPDNHSRYGNVMVNFCHYFDKNILIKLNDIKQSYHNSNQPIWNQNKFKIITDAPKIVWIIPLFLLLIHVSGNPTYFVWLLEHLKTWIIKYKSMFDVFLRTITLIWVVYQKMSSIFPAFIT